MDTIVTNPLLRTNQTNNFAYTVSLDGVKSDSSVTEGIVNGVETVVAPMVKSYASNAYPSLYTPYRDVAFRGPLVSNSTISALGIDTNECPIALTSINIDMSFKTNGFYSVGYFLFEDNQSWSTDYFQVVSIGAPMSDYDTQDSIDTFFAIPQLADNQIAVVAFSDHADVIPNGALLCEIKTKVGFYGTNDFM